VLVQCIAAYNSYDFIQKQEAEKAYQNIFITKGKF